MRRIFSTQHIETFLVIVVVVAMAFLLAFLLFGRLFRHFVRDQFVQCRLQVLAEILKVSQGSSSRFKVLNLHLPLPLDWDSEL